MRNALQKRILGLLRKKGDRGWELELAGRHQAGALVRFWILARPEGCAGSGQEPPPLVGAALLPCAGTFLLILACGGGCMQC